MGVPDELVSGVRAITYRSMRAVLRRNTAYVAERGVPERLAAVRVPLLVVFGAADPRWRPSSARRYEAVPDARIEMLPGVAAAPWLAVDDVAWPASWPTRIPARHGGRVLAGT